MASPQGRVDAAAERGEDAQPPIAQLVAEALDDDGAVGGEGAGGFLFVLQVSEQVRRQRSRSCEALRRASATDAWSGSPSISRRTGPARAELDRPADRIAVPERQLARARRERGKR